MKLTFKKYGQLQGRDLCEFVLENDHGMSVKLLNYGATLEDVAVPVDGAKRHVILSLKQAEDYSKERNFLGGTVGRIAGRVWRGQWKNGDHILQLPINDGKNHIHGGFGTDQQVWSFRPEQRGDFVSVHFSLLDPDGHNGFPGNLQLEATYTLNNSGELLYDLTAYSDKLTIFNPTNHTYFCLDGLGTKIDQTKLFLDADYYLPVKEGGLPVGGMEPVEGTAFDFRKGKSLEEALKSGDAQVVLRKGLDHPFILNGRKTAAEVVASDGKVSMKMSTNAPAIVVYTASSFGKGEKLVKDLPQYGGLTLEAQNAPAPGNDLREITLEPGKSWQRQVSWKFEY